MPTVVATAASAGATPVDASRQRRAADPAEARQHAVRAARGGPALRRASSPTASICRRGPQGDDPGQGTRALDPRHRCGLGGRRDARALSVRRHGGRARRPTARVRLPGGRTLAGSALTMDRAVRNIVEWGIADAGRGARDGVRPPASPHGAGLQRHSASACRSRRGRCGLVADLHVRSRRSFGGMRASTMTSRSPDDMT